MTHWHDTLADRPETEGAVYATGWTISGLAVLGTMVAAWIFGIQCAPIPGETCRSPIGTYNQTASVAASAEAALLRECAHAKSHSVADSALTKVSDFIDSCGGRTRDQILDLSRVKHVEGSETADASGRGRLVV